MGKLTLLSILGVLTEQILKDINQIYQPDINSNYSIQLDEGENYNAHLKYFSVSFLFLVFVTVKYVYKR